MNTEPFNQVTHFSQSHLSVSHFFIFDPRGKSVMQRSFVFIKYERWLHSSAHWAVSLRVPLTREARKTSQFHSRWAFSSLSGLKCIITWIIANH